MVSTAPTTSSTTVPVADGNWYHVAVTVDRDSLSPVGMFYVNGVHFPAGDFSPLPGLLTNPSPLLMGCSSLDLTECYRGALDEVELFRRVLTPGEIQLMAARRSNGKCKATPTATRPNGHSDAHAHANGDVDANADSDLTSHADADSDVTPACTVVPPPTAMTHWWPLDEQSGTIATDIVNPLTNGTLVNGPLRVPGMVAGGLELRRRQRLCRMYHTIPRSTSARGI